MTIVTRKTKNELKTLDNSHKFMKTGQVRHNLVKNKPQIQHILYMYVHIYVTDIVIYLKQYGVTQVELRDKSLAFALFELGPLLAQIC